MKLLLFCRVARDADSEKALRRNVIPVIETRPGGIVKFGCCFESWKAKYPDLLRNYFANEEAGPFCASAATQTKDVHENTVCVRVH